MPGQMYIKQNNSFRGFQHTNAVFDIRSCNDYGTQRLWGNERADELMSWLREVPLVLTRTLWICRYPGQPGAWNWERIPKILSARNGEKSLHPTSQSMEGKISRFYTFTRCCLAHVRDIVGQLYLSSTVVIWGKWVCFY